MSDPKSIPLHAYDLIDELAQRYPEEVYDAKVDREEFLLRQDARRLVLSRSAGDRPKARTRMCSSKPKVPEPEDTCSTHSRRRGS